jgi:Phytanoyl-CoA dioxygenase (PhyH)
MQALMNKFPGIPLVESPIFQDIVGDMDLSESEREIAQSLHQNGFAVFDFPDIDIEARIARIRAALSPVFQIDDNNASTSKFSGIGRIQDAWSSNDDIRAIAGNPQVIDLLSKLYGRRAFPFQTLNFPVGTQQHLHTDAVHFSSIPPRFMCGVWLAMEDIGPSSGPLCYAPGSHRWPLIDNALIGRRGSGSTAVSAQTPFQDAWNAIIAAKGATIETFEARKGQALIWCANLLHGGSPHLDPSQTRWSQVTHYYFDDCVYYTPAFSDEYLGRLALRDLVDIRDGSARKNLYLGEEILPPPPPRPKIWKRVRRYFGGVVSKARSHRAGEGTVS